MDSRVKGLGDPDPEFDRFAAREPLFAVLTAPEFRAANLTPEARRNFFESGEALVEALFRTIELRIAPHVAPTAILEYGCGIGRLALPLARHSARRGGTVTAVDRSPAMLVAARAEAAARGVTNIRYCTPPELFDGRAAQFDFVNCYLVPQRLRPADGLALMGALVSQILPGGIGVFQFPYRSRSSWLVQRTRWLRGHVIGVNRVFNVGRGQPADQPFIPSHTYDVDAVLLIFQEASFPAAHVVFDDHGDLDGAVVIVEAPISRRTGVGRDTPPAEALSAGHSAESSHSKPLPRRSTDHSREVDRRSESGGRALLRLTVGLGASSRETAEHPR